MCEYGRALVVGLGRSGLPAARALRDRGVAVTATDARTEAPDDLPDGIEVHLGTDGDALVPLVDEVDLLVPSPGVPETAPVIARAVERDVPIWSEPELGWRLAPHRVVGITGTNGKTSVTELTTAMLTTGGVDAVACGNIGHPFTTASLEQPGDVTLVAELSSFQLRFAGSLRPAVGVLLNLAPDHLDWHGDLDAYGRAKARLWEAQQPGDWAVANLDDEPAATLARQRAPQQVAWTSHRSLPDVGVGVVDGVLTARLPDLQAPIVAIDELATVAPHHVSNVAAAACAALLTGADPDAVAEAATAFRPGRHRLERVASAGGVDYVDDSKATNVHAAIASLRAFPDRTIIWIAGGLAKGVDLRPLAAALDRVRHGVFIGTSAGELAAVAASVDVAGTFADSIEEAVEVATRLAEPGDVVLLAPACASFDQFRDYAERGDRFAAAARAVGDAA